MEQLPDRKREESVDLTTLPSHDSRADSKYHLKMLTRF